jgi:hypothetical protein
MTSGRDHVSQLTRAHKLSFIGRGHHEVKVG